MVFGGLCGQFGLENTEESVHGPAQSRKKRRLQPRKTAPGRVLRRRDRAPAGTALFPGGCAKAMPRALRMPIERNPLND